jgi:HAE1 family hydrophobic/amphiphilic exporter-1
MFSLPTALVGVLLGLFLTGNSLNIFSLLGIIMLTGIVTRNAILIIDFANILQTERGMPRKEALMEAGRLRLRPVIMTSAALIFALLPVLLSTSEGSESRQPLAAVLIGGSVTSGFLSLFLIPVIYNILEVFSEKAGRGMAWLGGRAEEPKAQPPTTAQTPAPGPASGK